jgi:hypothetical protein
MANEHSVKAAPNSVTLENLKEIMGEDDFNECSGEYPRSISAWRALLTTVNSKDVSQDKLRKELELAGFFGNI